MPAAPRPQPVAPVVLVSGDRPDRLGRRRSRESFVLPTKNSRDKLTELAGSMLLAAVVAAIASVLLMMVVEPNQPARFAWLALVSSLGAWSVLIPAKLWEGTDGEAMLRRLTLFGVGLGLGVCAWGIDQALAVDLPYSLNPHIRSVGDSLHVGSRGSSLFYNSDGSVTLTMRHVLLLVSAVGAQMVRWRSAARETHEPVDHRDLLPVGGGFEQVLAVPRKLGRMTAATMALAIQLASPWVSADTDLRVRLRSNRHAPIKLCTVGSRTEHRCAGGADRVCGDLFRSHRGGPCRGGFVRGLIAVLLLAAIANGLLFGIFGPASGPSPSTVGRLDRVSASDVPRMGNEGIAVRSGRLHGPLGSVNVTLNAALSANTK